MTATLHALDDSGMRDGSARTIVSGPVLPLLEAIEEYTGCDRPEAVRRTAHYVERLWDAGIIMMPSAVHLAGRFRIPTLIAVLVFALGVVVGNLDPIRLDLPYLIET